MYQKGDHVRQDHAIALKWLQIAADKADGPAEKELGLMYAYGKGVAPNSQKAISLLKSAVSHKAPGAKDELKKYKSSKFFGTTI